MTFMEDDGAEPEFDPSEFGTTYADPEPAFRADAYEQLKLTQEKRRLEEAKRAKFDSKLPCMEAALELAARRLKVETEKRLAAEAERDRVRAMRELVRERRRASRDRRRAAEAESRTEEVKAQAAHLVQQTAMLLKEFGRDAQDEREKRVMLELRLHLDPQNAEFRTCPKCGATMGEAEHGAALVCSDCGHRKKLMPDG